MNYHSPLARDFSILLSPSRRGNFEAGELQNLRENQTLKLIKLSVDESVEGLRTLSAAAAEALMDLSPRPEVTLGEGQVTPTRRRSAVEGSIVRRTPTKVNQPHDADLRSTIVFLKDQGVLPMGLDEGWLVGPSHNTESYLDPLSGLPQEYPRRNSELIDTIRASVMVRLVGAVTGSSTIVSKLLSTTAKSSQGSERAMAMADYLQSADKEDMLRLVGHFESRERQSIESHSRDSFTAIGKLFDVGPLALVPPHRSVSVGEAVNVSTCSQGEANIEITRLQEALEALQQSAAHGTQLLAKDVSGASPHRANEELLVTMIQDLERRHDQDAETIRDQSQKLEAVTRHSNHIQEQYDSLMVQLTEAAQRAGQLDEEVASLSGSLKFKDGTIIAATAQIDDLQLEKDTLSRRIAELENDAASNKRELWALAAQCNTLLESSVHDASTEGITSENTSQWVRRCNDLLEEMWAKSSIWASFSLSLARLNDSIEKQWAEERVAPQHTSLGPAVSFVDIEMLRRQLEDSESDVARLRKQIDYGKAVNDRLQSEVTEERNKQTGNPTSLDDLRRELATAQRALTESEKACRSFSHQLNAARHLTETGESDISIITTKATQLEADLSTARETIAKLTEELQMSTTELSNVRTIHGGGFSQHHQDQLAAFAAASTDQQNVIDALHSDLATAQSHAQVAQQALAESEAVCRSLSEQLAVATSRCSELEQQVDTVNAELRSLRHVGTEDEARQLAGETRLAELQAELGTARETIANQTEELKKSTPSDQLESARQQTLAAESAADQLQKQLATAHERIAALTDDLEKHTDALSKERATIANSGDAASELQKMIDGLHSDLASAQSHAQVAQQALAESEAACRSLSEQLAGATSRCSELEQQVDTVNAELRSLRHVGTEDEARQLAGETRLAELQAELGTAHETIANQTEELKKTANELSDIRAAIQSADALSQQHQAASADQQKLCDALRSELSTAQSDSQATKQAHVELEASCRSLSDQLESARQQTLAAESAADQLQKQLETARERIASLTDELEKHTDALSKERATIANSGDELQKVIDGLHSDLASAQSHAQVAQQALAESEAVCRSLSEQLAGATSRCSELEKQIKHVGTEDEAKQLAGETRLAELQAELETARETIANQTEELQKTANDLTEIRGAVQSADALSQQHQDQLTASAAASADQQKLIDALRSELSAAQSERQALASQASEYRGEVTRLAAEAKDAEATAASLRTQLDALRDTHADLEAKMRSAQSAAEQGRAEMRGAREDLEDARGRLQDCEHEVSRLQKQLESSRALVDKLRAAGDDDADRLRALEEQVVEFDQIRRRLSEEEGKRRSMEAALGEARSKLEECAALHASLERAAAASAATIRSLQSENGELAGAAKFGEDSLATKSTLLRNSEEALRKAQADYQKLQQLLEEAESGNALLKRQMAEEINNRAAAEDRLAASVTKLESSTSDATHNQRLLEQATSNADRLQAQASHYADRLRELEATLATASEARRNAEEARGLEAKEVQLANQKLASDFGEKIELLILEVEALAADNATTTQQNGVLKQQLEETVEQLAEALETLEAANEALAEARSLKVALEHQLAELSEDAARLMSDFNAEQISNEERAESNEALVAETIALKEELGALNAALAETAEALEQTAEAAKAAMAAKREAEDMTTSLLASEASARRKEDDLSKEVLRLTEELAAASVAARALEEASADLRTRVSDGEEATQRNCETIHALELELVVTKDKAQEAANDVSTSQARVRELEDRLVESRQVATTCVEDLKELAESINHLEESKATAEESSREAKAVSETFEDQLALAADALVGARIEILEANEQHDRANLLVDYYLELLSCHQALPLVGARPELADGTTITDGHEAEAEANETDRLVADLQRDLEASVSRTSLLTKECASSADACEALRTQMIAKCTELDDLTQRYQQLEQSMEELTKENEAMRDECEAAASVNEELVLSREVLEQRFNQTVDELQKLTALASNPSSPVDVNSAANIFQVPAAAPPLKVAAPPMEEMDKRFQNIAWLVATRGAFVSALGEFNKCLYLGLNHISVKSTRMRFMEVLRDFLSPVEKLHLGLPQEIAQIEPFSREASQRELFRMLIHSSINNSYPGQDPPAPGLRLTSRTSSPEKALSPRSRAQIAPPIPQLHFSSKPNSRSNSPTTGKRPNGTVIPTAVRVNKANK